MRKKLLLAIVLLTATNTFAETTANKIRGIPSPASAAVNANVAAQNANTAAQNANSAAQAVPTPADADMTADVQARLVGNSSLNGVNIKVSSSGGVVTLTGVLPNQAQIDEAVRVAKLAPGVKRVESNLSLMAP